MVDEIKAWIRSLTKVPVSNDHNENPEILLIEVGGTVGDLESSSYYEAIRQMSNEDGKDQVGLVFISQTI